VPETGEEEVELLMEDIEIQNRIMVREVWDFEVGGEGT
jgi:hypothetical protein